MQKSEAWPYETRTSSYSRCCCDWRVGITDAYLVDRYQQILFACLTGDAVQEDADDLIDWRYFYTLDDGIGRSTCGFAQQAGAQYLRSVVTADRFLSPKWYESLTMASSNPAVQGFLTEQMLLSYM